MTKEFMFWCLDTGLQQGSLSHLGALSSTFPMFLVLSRIFAPQTMLSDQDFPLVGDKL